MLFQILAIPLISGWLLGIGALVVAGTHALRGGPIWYSRLIVRNALLGGIASILVAGVLSVAADFLLAAILVAAAELPLGFVLPLNVLGAFGLSGGGWLALATTAWFFEARQRPTGAPA